MKIELDNPVVKDWTNGEKIIASFWSEKEENLRVLVKDSNEFSLYRFFNSGGVQCSVDVRSMPENAFIPAMFRNLLA